MVAKVFIFSLCSSFACVKIHSELAMILHSDIFYGFIVRINQVVLILLAFSGTSIPNKVCLLYH